ncbi:MAG: alpha/beta hydrolase [Acetobacteraceae bacterium]
MRRTLGAIVVSGLLSACSPLGLLNATVPSGGVRITRDVPYGDGPARTLDVYQPAEPGQDRPLVVFFFGGSWKTGNKAEYRFVGTALARRGIVVAIPDYRLYPQTTFPGFLDDAAASVAWAVAHAAEFGANPHPFLIGHSAGAYIAIMLALNPAYLTEAGLPPRQIAGGVGIAGPYDFHPSQLPDIAPVFAGSPESRTQPIAFADGANRPLLLLAGADDTTVRPYNTTALAARIAAHCGPVESRVYPGIGHIGILLAFAPLFVGKAPVVADVTRFVEANEPPARGSVRPCARPMRVDK